MSNEQNPSPWSRQSTPSGANEPTSPIWQQASQPDATQQGPVSSTGPLGTAPQAPQPMPRAPWPGESVPAQPQAGAPGVATSATYPTPAPTPNTQEQWGPSAPFGAPSQPSTATTATKQPKGRSRMAGVLAVALLAAGVGGGAGFAASQLSLGDATPAASSSSTGSTTVLQGDPTNPDWSAVAAAASKAVVAIDVVTASGEGQGSGVVIDAEGHIVTNNHVISGARNNTVTVLLGTRSYEATTVGTDPSTDLAVIKLVDPPADLPVMAYGDQNDLTVGDPVMAIGNPLGLADTATTGIVSALNRPVTTTAVTEQQTPGFGQMTGQASSETVVTAAIQTNAAINPGNSGGALVNANGELVGVTSSIATLSSGQGQSGSIGIGFAIGSDQVQYVAEQLIATGKAQHPQLGLSARDVDTIGQLGAIVVSVNPGSPAAEAGLRDGDLVTAVDGQPVSSSESLVALVRSGQVGKEMQLSITRGGSEAEVTLTPVAANA